MLAFIDNLRLALRTFVGNPLRSMLTLLGIVIGVATVICMMGMIEGLRIKVNKDLSSLGADVFQATKWPVGFGRFDWQKYARRPNLTLEDRDAILALPSVRTASATDDEGGQKIATANAETKPSVQVIGATPEYVETSGVMVVSGRFLGEPDEVDQRSVAVLGLDVVDVLFPNMNPVGQEIRIHNRPFQVIGVLQRRGSFLGLASLDNRVIIPLSTFGSMFGAKRSVDVNVQATTPELLDRAQGEVTNLLRRRRQLGPSDPNSFEVFTNDTMTKTFNNLSQVITVASFGVCLLSLIVGGIGILNIMLMSVTERTREIGVRKALGARRRRILAQFATEAIVLSLVGGMIGVSLGFGLAFLARWVFSFTIEVPTWAVLLSIGMSSAVGLIFGIYPASRAAKLDPVEAMRAE
ncbi:MAG: ABC transporter permease [Myxococcaceae bacterium]